MIVQKFSYKINFLLSAIVFNNNKFIMSFFPLEPRLLFSSSKKQPLLGPGSYQPLAKNPTNNSHGYAPFGSLSRKKATTQPTNSLGPGQYEVSGQIVKPSITKYQNSNSIIIKINEQGWSQFKSKTNRFQHLATQNSILPGPGQYSPQKVRPKSQSKQMKKNSIGEKIKQMNLQNYNERRRPTLFSDPVKADTQEHHQKIRSKGTSWSLNKKQRFQPLQKESFQEQHKQQLIQQIKGQKKKERAKSQSAVFASKSLKSQMEAEIYQTNNPFKVELRKMINYKDQRPGPGSYNYQDNEFSKNIKFQKHQFFGSTVERFKTSDNIGPNLGPGYYSPAKEGQGKSLNKKNLQINEVELNRHSYIPSSAIDLGPGSYSSDKGRKHKASCKWVFGSKQPRFSQQSTIQQNQEEIDQYDLLRKLRKQKQFEYRKQFLKGGNHANFASKSNRFEQMSKGAPNIPIGHYDTAHTDIATKVKKSVMTEKQMQRINRHVVSVPFMSTVNRFQHRQEEDEDHTHHDCWCLVKSVEKQVYHHQSASFTSKQKRTVVFESKNHRYTPAVGSYTPQSSFVKSSFNSKFLKASQTKSKKLKIWNNQKQNLEKKPTTASAREKQISMIKIA